MNRTKLSWTVGNIEKMFEEKKVLSFEHPIQRPSEQWSDSQKSLLVHSLLANYPVPAIYVLREDSEQLDEKKKPIFNYFVLDGKQRLTSILSFIWGEFPLDENIPNIVIEEEEYEIAGKYFCDLPEPVQYEVKRYKFEIFCFEQCTAREIEEIFYRLNNSTPLSKAQVAKAKVGISVAEFINEMLATSFFKDICNFSKAQLKASDNQRSLIQAMMLFDTNLVPDFTLTDFSETSILEYSESIRDRDNTHLENTIRSAIEYLEDALMDKSKYLRKISIPMVLYLADVAQDYSIKTRIFKDWWNYFNEEDELFELYKTFCSSGSTKLEKIKGRLAIMTKSFCLYNEVDIPAELKSLVEEVEEKLASKEEKEEKEKVTTEEAESVSVLAEETALTEDVDASPLSSDKDITEQDASPVENDNPETSDTTTSSISEDVAGNEEPLEEENPSSDSEPLDEQPA